MVNLYRMRMLMSRKTVNLLWRIEQEQARATKITTVLTGMPRGGKGSDQVADGAVRITELKEAYSESIAELEMMRQELLPLINTLDNVDLRAAMLLRYIKGRRPEEIADAISLADRTIYRYLLRAENELCRRYPDKIIHGQKPQNCQ
jgi:DNA-directed RNA polymerase specialized sigma24 family protein